MYYKTFVAALLAASSQAAELESWPDFRYGLGASTTSDSYFKGATIGSGGTSYSFHGPSGGLNIKDLDDGYSSHRPSTSSHSHLSHHTRPSSSYSHDPYKSHDPHKTSHSHYHTHSHTKAPTKKTTNPSHGYPGSVYVHKKDPAETNFRPKITYADDDHIAIEYKDRHGEEKQAVFDVGHKNTNNHGSNNGNNGSNNNSWSNGGNNNQGNGNNNYGGGNQNNSWNSNNQGKSLNDQRD